MARSAPAAPRRRDRPMNPEASTLMKSQLTGAALLTMALAACTKSEPAAQPAPPASASPSAPGELVYVSNEDSRNLTVIDAATDTVVATIEVGTRPRGVKVSPDGKTVYVALSGSPK